MVEALGRRAFWQGHIGGREFSIRTRIIQFFCSYFSHGEAFGSLKLLFDHGERKVVGEVARLELATHTDVMLMLE